MTNSTARTKVTLLVIVVAALASARGYCQSDNRVYDVLTRPPTLGQILDVAHSIVIARIVTGRSTDQSNRYSISTERRIKGNIGSASLDSSLQLKVGADYLLFICGERRDDICAAMEIATRGIDNRELPEKMAVVGLGPWGWPMFLVPGDTLSVLKLGYSTSPPPERGTLYLRSAYSLSSVLAYIRKYLDTRSRRAGKP